jgi:MFS transporter, OFA family, oxalate/formate antiporter
LKQPKIFYGWWIVVAVALISAYSSGIAYYGFTAILEPITKQFGWSYAEVSVAASLNSLIAAILSPLVGFLIDRWGPRKLIIAGAISMGLGLFLLGQINSLAMFYESYVLIAIGNCANGSIIVMTVVGRWFHRRISIATGVALGIGALGGLWVPVVTRIIDLYQWQAAMRIFGIGACCIILPLALIVRHKPEQYGLLPDGEDSQKPVTGANPVPTQNTDTEVTVKEALKSKAFWHIALGFMCHATVLIAVLTHIMPYLSSIGISRSISSLVASAIILMEVLGIVTFGWLGDRYGKRRIAALGLTLTALGMLLLSFAGNTGTWLLIPFILVCGVGFGGPIPMTSPILRQYFGRARLGTVLGFTTGIMLIGCTVGAPLAGWVYDRFHNYQAAWLVSIVILLVGIISFLTTPPVKKIEPEQTSTVP